ncbi:MAG: SMP-30/gluconolactonase/LRE family protein [Bacteroidetes bacterium]|nr:SMP-30/gluconolactonase/LRE family protein [Bacteroidota bacterium]
MKKYYVLQILLLAFIITVFSKFTYAQSPVPAEAVLEKLETGFLQPEGPVWIDSLGLLFSDIKANKIYRWSPGDSSLTTYLAPSDSSNGLTLDLQGRLVLTQMAKRRVARQESDGTITPITSTYNEKKYNSPNDLVVKSDGSIFFTDPDFNTPKGQSKELNFKGVFRISPFGGVYALDSTSFPAWPAQNEPNGICFSPDESKLYVNDSPLRKIYVWDVVNDSTIADRKLLFTIPVNGYADGMKVDADGNIYCTGPLGVWIISPDGNCLDTIRMQENPSNCAWGDADRKSLYITAGSSLYRIRLARTTEVKKHGYLPVKTFELHNNYPNPFNPATTIEYHIKNNCRLKIKIFDVLGSEVATLIDGYQSSGMYAIKWDASGMPSGIYFCRMYSGEFIQTKKIALVK